MGKLSFSHFRAEEPERPTALFPARVVQVVVRCFEEFLREFSDDVRIVVLAREYVQVHGVRLVGEVTGDKRGLDELCHRITRYPLVLAEVDDDGLTKALHVDALAQLNDELLDLIRAADRCGIASVDVNARVQTPSVDELILGPYRYIGGCCFHL